MRSWVAGTVVVAGSVVLAAPSSAQHSSAVRPRLTSPPVVSRGVITRWQPAGRTVTGAPPAPVVRVTTASQAPPSRPMVYLREPRAVAPPLVWGAALGWPLGYFGAGPYLVTFFLPSAEPVPQRSPALKPDPDETAVAEMGEPSGDDGTPAKSATAEQKGVSVGAL